MAIYNNVKRWNRRTINNCVTFTSLIFLNSFRLTHTMWEQAFKKVVFSFNFLWKLNTKYRCSKVFIVSLVWQYVRVWVSLSLCVCKCGCACVFTVHAKSCYNVNCWHSNQPSRYIHTHSQTANKYDVCSFSFSTCSFFVCDIAVCAIFVSTHSDSTTVYTPSIRRKRRNACHCAKGTQTEFASIFVVLLILYTQFTVSAFSKIDVVLMAFQVNKKYIMLYPKKHTHGISQQQKNDPHKKATITN